MHYLLPDLIYIRTDPTTVNQLLLHRQINHLKHQPNYFFKEMCVDRILANLILPESFQKNVNRYFGPREAFSSIESLAYNDACF